MFYGFRVEKALLDMGIDANQISPDYRREMKEIGKISNIRPQEIALVIAARTPLSLQLNINVTTVRDWIVSKKVDRTDEKIRSTLMELGMYDLL